MCPHHSKNAQLRNVNNVTEATIKLPIKGRRSTALPVNYSQQALIRTGGGRGAKVWRVRHWEGCDWGGRRGAAAREGWQGSKRNSICLPHLIVVKQGVIKLEPDNTDTTTTNTNNNNDNNNK